jgi:hypothetical protein
MTAVYRISQLKVSAASPVAGRQDWIFDEFIAGRNAENSTVSMTMVRKRALV